MSGWLNRHFTVAGLLLAQAMFFAGAWLTWEVASMTTKSNYQEAFMDGWNKARSLPAKLIWNLRDSWNRDAARKFGAVLDTIARGLGLNPAVL